MIKVKRIGRNGKVHWLRNSHEWTALCGMTDPKGDWMPIRSDVSLWGECIRCLAIRHKAQTGQKEGT